jgi:UDPglucose 6-dehydrogenase
MLRDGVVPIFEQGLPDLIVRGLDRGLLSFHTSNSDAIEGARLVFLCLPTPEGPNGRADLSFIRAVVDELATLVEEGCIFVIKSTVPPGTAASLSKRLADLGSPAHVVSHPEFLREGKAVEDFTEPDRIVIGAYEESDAEAVAELYRGVETRFVFTDPTSSEMIKYASNSYLAARLTFVNSLANLCEAVGADVMAVVDGMGMDHRIGPHFLHPGPGYGGSCFPKDTAALIGVAEDSGYDFGLLRAVVEADEAQRGRVADKVLEAAGGSLAGKVVAMWGVAFKAGTDDVRESPALRVAAMLVSRGARVVAYDPEATSDSVEMAPSAVDAAREADVLLVATEWPEFTAVDLAEVASVMRGNRVVDARNLLSPTGAREAGLDYWGLGRPNV